MAKNISKYANEYDNILLENIPKNLIYIDKKRLQPVCRKLNIQFLDVIVGFKENKYGYKPEKCGVAVFPSDHKKLIEYFEQKNIKKKKTPARVAAAKKAAETRKKNIEIKKEKQRQHNLARRRGDLLSKDLADHVHKWVIDTDEHIDTIYELYYGLFDINAAHPEWLEEAIYAFETSIVYEGIMHKWLKNTVDLSFYDCICRAIGAFRRHEKTKYDTIITEMAEDIPWEKLDYDERQEAKKELQDDARIVANFEWNRK